MNYKFFYRVSLPCDKKNCQKLQKFLFSISHDEYFTYGVNWIIAEFPVINNMESLANCITYLVHHANFMKNDDKINVLFKDSPTASYAKLKHWI